MDYTEFDEQSNTKKEALAILYSKVIEYLDGKETLAVVSNYEIAALNKMATHLEIERLWDMAEH